MKTKLNTLLAGVMAVFCCSIGRAQLSYSGSLTGATLIYSNSFSGGAGVNITNTTIDFSANILGGSNSPAWIDVGGSGDTNAFYANGAMGTPQGDSWELPFTPQPGYVYTLTATVNFSGNPGSWVVAGFAQNYAMNTIGNAPPNGSAPSSCGWTLRNYTGNTEYFSGPVSGTTIYNNVPDGPTGNGTYTYTQIWDTTGSKYVTTAYFGGVQLGTPFTYASNPSIHALLLGQHVYNSPGQANYKWTGLTLSAAPMVILQQPVSTNIDVGSSFTNTIVVAATSPSYQWYKDGAPITDATNASLIFNSVATSDNSTNYYVIVTNSFNSSCLTSTVASLIIFTNPVITSAYPVAYTNPMTLFGGNNNYVGASPTFSVSTLGGQPMAYQWLTNSVAVGGATNASFTFTNCQLSSPTTFSCVSSNSYATATTNWSVSYIQTPTAPFPQLVLTNHPLSFWRLNEPFANDDGNGNNGVICQDYNGGNNGIYSNVYFGDASYTNSDPTTLAINVGSYAGASGVFGIQGIDFSAPTNSNAAFSVEAWVNGPSTQVANAGVIAKGYGGAEQFALDVSGGKFRFSVRNAAGVISTATAAVGPDGITWDEVVGVCDEANSNILIYVNGLQSGRAAITANSGVLGTTQPTSIGTRSSSSANAFDWYFQGDIADAAVWNYALSASQVATFYMSPGFKVPITFIPPAPPTNYTYIANTTISIPATIFSVLPVGYYWTNLTAGTLIASGSTNALENLDATLTIPNAPASLSGDQLELVVTNADLATNVFVSLFSPAPPISLDYSSPILYSNFFNGGTYSVAGVPLTAANALVGGTNATWVDALGINDAGMLQANGISTTKQGDTWLLPFIPEPGYIYTVTAEVTINAYPGSWIGAGFAQTLPINATPNCAFNNGAVNGYGFDILTAGGTQNLQAFQGPAGGGGCVNSNYFYPAVPATYTNVVVFDTTANNNWTVTWYVDGARAGSTNYTTPPPIHAVAITQNAFGAPPSGVQWDYVAVTQAGPNGGLPPYAYNPAPPTSMTIGAGMPLSIQTSAFGSAPFGYYWSNTNTATVLGSGTTNNTVPISANLSVASVPLAWNGNKLALTVTNAYGTNISWVSLTVTNTVIVPTNKPTITGFSLVGGTNVVINATNGVTGGTYYLLGSTNVATPLSQWLPLATNVIVTNGSSANGFTFSGTNVVGRPQQFYILSNTN